MIKLRKFEYPTLIVFYGNKVLGKIENEHELLLFRHDLLGKPDVEKYSLITPSGRVTFNKYGNPDGWKMLPDTMSLTSSLLQKQLDLTMDKKSV